MRRCGLIALMPLLTSACELQEVTVAPAEPFIVVESYLVAGDSSAVAALHTSVGGRHLLDSLTGLQLTRDGVVARFAEVGAYEGCLAPGTAPPDDERFPGGFACFESAPVEPIAPDALYRMDVALADGSRLTGATRVPAQVVLASDTGEDPVMPCYLEPWTQTELTWSSTEGAAAFVLDLRAFGVRDALESEGVVADIPDPVILRGLAIGSQDTAIVLPAEFGLFDRFSLDPALILALQRGMPPGVDFDVTVAAVDQNFVDWVRGGDFNPSGLIRTPSLFGDAGTGVIASMSIDAVYGTTRDDVLRTSAATSGQCGSPVTS